MGQQDGEGIDGDLAGIIEALAEPKIINGGEKMELLEVFEKVNLVTPLEQRRFFNYFNDSVAELEATFGVFLYEKDGVYEPPKDLSQSVPVLPLYQNAIVDNILYLAGQGETYKSEFVRKARQSYLKYWRDNAKGKRVKRARW